MTHNLWHEFIFSQKNIQVCFYNYIFHYLVPNMGIEKQNFLNVQNKSKCDIFHNNYNKKLIHTIYKRVIFIT